MYGDRTTIMYQYFEETMIAINPIAPAQFRPQHHKTSTPVDMFLFSSSYFRTGESSRESVINDGIVSLQVTERMHIPPFSG